MIWEEHVERIRKMKSVQNILVGQPEEKSGLGYTGIDWKIILKWILEKSGVGWTQLAQRVSWRTFVKTKTNFRVP
jgi:hypothetical protein